MLSEKLTILDLQQVSNFYYLGKIIQNNGTEEDEINQRTEKAKDMLLAEPELLKQKKSIMYNPNDCI